MSNSNNQLDIQQILELLPHRYPFLLVDRVLHYDITGDRKILKAVKNVSFNEPFFQGHFPGKPVLPGVLILEAMAQATGVLAFTMVGKPQADELYYFASIDNIRRRIAVAPCHFKILTASRSTGVRAAYSTTFSSFSITAAY